MDVNQIPEINNASDKDGDNNNGNRRRSKRLAAKIDDQSNQLMQMILDNLEKQEQREQQQQRSANAKAAKKIIKNNKTDLKTCKNKRNETPETKTKEITKTLFDRGFKAKSILGATSVEDENNGNVELCYLVKFDNGKFDLVLNKVAHKYCPMLVLDFLESKISFKDNEIPNLSMTNSNENQSNTSAENLNKIFS